MSKWNDKIKRGWFKLTWWWAETKTHFWFCWVEIVRFLIYKTRFYCLLSKRQRTYWGMWVSSVGDKEYARSVVYRTYDSKPDTKDA